MTLVGLAAAGFAGFAASAALVALLRRWASRRRLLDLPNERSLHSQPTPLGGGLAIVAVVVAGMGVCALAGVVEATPALVALGGGAILVAAVSWFDDLRGLPVVVRLSAHGAAAVALMVALAGAAAGRVPVSTPAGQVACGFLALVWIVGLTNAYNFMDGIDGIAGTQAVVAGLGWVALTWGSAGVETWLGLLLAAASLGFLVHNWPPAKIFMGDVGSAFLGFVFAALAIVGAQHDPRLAIAGVLLVWPFVFDTSFTFLRRLRRGENVFQAHRSHLYQRLVLAGYSHRFVTCLYGALAVLGVALALIWVGRIGPAGWLVPSGLAVAMVGLWLLRRRSRAPSPSVRPVFVTAGRARGGLWFVALPL